MLGADALERELSKTASEAFLTEEKSAAEPLKPTSVYRVEDAEISADGKLPSSIPLDKVMTNIVNNLNFEGWTERARHVWFKDFTSAPSRQVIADAFWFCICYYFKPFPDRKPGERTEIEEMLFDRISKNYVELYNLIPQQRKDFFFKRYSDAISQAVLYSMFLAYPKSRIWFTDKFRKDLVGLFSYWTTGIQPEFVTTAHWKLNLGGGDVLSTTAQLQGRDEDKQKDPSTKRAPRPVRTLRNSPLVAHFLSSKKYSSANLIRPLCMALTTAEERCRLMDVKHGLLVERAHASRQRSDALGAEFEKFHLELKQQEKQSALAMKAARKKLEVRRKEVLRADTREYANYLASINLLQEMGSRP